jgi:trimethylamine--corrinoid protein Co-methyltransferase
MHGGYRLAAATDITGGTYKPLSASDIETIHEASLEVFSQIGIRVKNREAFDLFRAAGARADSSTSMVLMEPEMVMELLSRAPSVITLYGKTPEHTLEVGGTRAYAGSGGSALNVLDHRTQEKRRARLSDLCDIARVIESLENIHFFMLPIFPEELHEGNVDVNRFGVGLTYSTKHIMGGVYSVEGIQNVRKMATMVAGSESEFRERPNVSMVTCCGISPFVLDEHYSRLTLECVRSGIPVVTPVEPLCGATAPVTLAGNLVVQNVDTLAGVMLAQLAEPGAPVFYGCISSLADMKDMKYLSGAVEMGLMNAAAAQLAHHYGIPIYTTAGMSDSKTLDAQAGFESAMTTLMVALAGGNIIHDAAGFLEFCMVASLEKYVLDNEIIGMAMRAARGIEINDDTLALDVMRKVGAGGHFVSVRHTRKFMRKEQYMPVLADRSTREEWNERGSPETKDRARKRVDEILEAPLLRTVSDGVLARIRSEIPGVVTEAI